MRRACAFLLVLVVAVIAGCSSSSPAKRPTSSTCTWSARASAGVLVEDGRVLYSFDPGSGQRLGSCAGDGTVSGQPPLTVGGRSFAEPAPQYARPMVAGAGLQSVPDNVTPGDQSSTQGGIRVLSSGARRALPFPGWLVVTTIGARLLLERFDAGEQRLGEQSTTPDDWCVLPRVSSPHSACTAVPGASTPGGPAVTPDGTLSWVPATGVPLTVGRLHGYAASDGTRLTAWAPAAGDTDQQPVGTDEHTIVFPAGGQVSPTGSRTLQWAVVERTDGALRAMLHDSGITQAAATSTRFELVDPLGGVQGSPDGHSVAMMGQTSHRVLVVDDSGHVTTVNLALPAHAQAGLIRWPFDRRTSG